MKRILFLLFLSSFFTSIFSQKININWEGNKTVDYGNVSYVIPYFSNKNYSVFNGVPYLTQTISPKEGEEYTIKNLIWESIKINDLQDLRIDKIPLEEIAEVNSQVINGKSYTNITVGTFKKVQSSIFRLVSFELVPDNKKSIKTITTRPSLINNFSTENPLKQGNFYKIKVDKTGIFKITSKFLRDHGINPANINPKNFRIYGNGGLMLPEDNSDFRFPSLQENAIQVIGEDDGKWDDGDYALFYAQGPHGYNLHNTNNGKGFKRKETRMMRRSENVTNVYEDFAYYFINFDQGPGKRTSASDISSAPNPFTRYDDYQYINEEKVNFLNIGRLWVGEPFNKNQSITFNLKSPIQSIDNVRVKTSVFVQNATQDKISFTLNNQNTVSYTVTNNASNKILEIPWETTVKNLSGNTIKIDYAVTTNNPLVSYNLDFLEVQYKEDLKFNDTQMNFRVFDIPEGNGATYGFLMSNNTNPDQVWDVSDITNAKRIVNKSSLPNQFSFGYTANNRFFNNEFVAFKASAAYEPKWVEKVENQDLASLQNIDYLIICPKDFILQADRLANYYKTKKNFNTAVVDVKKIYNEFSSGSKDITAIRDFITKLNTPSGSLKYVLLLGDTSFDFRNKTTSNQNLILSYQSEYSEDFESSFVTDDYFVMTSLQNSPFLFTLFPDIPIGRLPAQNIDEAKKLIDKTLAYYNALPGQATPFGDWRLRMNYVVDDDQDTRISGSSNPYLRGTFHDAMDHVLKTIFENNSDKPEYNIRKLYLDSFPGQSTAGGQRFPQVNQAISNAMNNSLYLYYFGHGGINGWAQERVLTTQEISGFNNFNNIYSRFPFVSTITCEFALWDDHNTFSAGEQLIKLPQGGAHAMITSSRAISVIYGRLYTENFTRNLFTLNNDDFQPLGNAFLNSKLEYGIDTNHFKINFLGDPALQFSRPKKLIEIEKIESPVNGQLRALDFVKITGSIKNNNGTINTNFNGKVLISIFDKKNNKRTLNNDGNLTPILDYLEEGTAIVKASGVAVNGKFTVEFYIPKDINFTVGDGRILAYADNGVFDVFNNVSYKIGEINPNGVNDNQPPKVQLYMNNTNFVDGGITNANPNLLACVTDDTGINSTGSGVGHDITVILDGEIVNTIVANDFYTPGSGNGCINPSFQDYQKGSVVYPFQNLKPGNHQLTFKVWDINNNSATQSLNFIVKDSSTDNLVINRLLNWPNPFTEKTYIQFEHNCDDILEVNTQIYTITGKLVRTLTNVVSSSPFMEGFRTGKTEIEWDGLDDYGAPIGKGTYLYKVFVKSTNKDKCNGTASAIEKMVILK